MKLEFDVDPNMVRFIVLAVLVCMGVNYDKIMVLVGI